MAESGSGKNTLIECFARKENFSLEKINFLNFPKISDLVRKFEQATKMRDVKVDMKLQSINPFFLA